MSLLLLLAACGNPLEFGGDDIDDFESVAPQHDTNGAVSDDTGGSSSCAEDTNGVSATLTLTGGDGQIAVQHTNVVDDCCALWDLRAEGDGPGRILVVYENTATETCGGAALAFDYTIPGVPAGIWTVLAHGDEGTVEVR